MDWNIEDFQRRSTVAYFTMEIELRPRFIPFRAASAFFG